MDYFIKQPKPKNQTKNQPKAIMAKTFYRDIKNNKMSVDICNSLIL